MALTKDEITPGVIAYFEMAKLNGNADVTKPSYPTTRDGPFICAQAEAGRSVWSPLTTQFRRERLCLDRSEIEGGAGLWDESDIYLNDGACTYIGPDESFVEASVAVDNYGAAARPKGSADTVAAVLGAIRQRRGEAL